MPTEWRNLRGRAETGPFARLLSIARAGLSSCGEIPNACWSQIKLLSLPVVRRTERGKRTTDFGQPAQRTKEHRAENGAWKEAIQQERLQSRSFVTHA